MISIRNATINDVSDIESMVAEYVQAREAGAQFLNGGGDDRVSRLYERVAIGHSTRRCHLSGKAFQAFADLDHLSPREIVHALPNKDLGLEPAELH